MLFGYYYGSSRLAFVHFRSTVVNLTNEEIAENLQISPHTVKRHIENMLAKTGYKSRVDLAVNAKTIGLVVHEDDRIEQKNTFEHKNGGQHGE